MKVYTNTTFEGHYPVGSAAVVVARNKSEAADWLNTDLVERGLNGNVKPEDMHELPTDRKCSVVLCDGDY